MGADNKRNLCAHDECGNGDINAVLAGCDVVIDHVYHTKACQQAMMETFRTYCSIDTYGRLNVLSSTQIVFHARRNIANALHIPKSMVRVSKPRIGGGFGAKQTAVSEVYPAFVTWMTKKPSKLIFSRVESQTASSPRHEMEMHVRLGATKDGIVKLLDFGSARYSIGDKSKSLDVILKVGYAPKEQYIRRSRQGPFTDVYSCAACFYAAITGFLPPESLERLDEDTLVPISQCGIEIPEYLDKAILKGLAVQPEDRFQSAAEFLDAIESQQVVEVPASGGAAPAPVPEKKNDQARPHRRHCRGGGGRVGHRHRHRRGRPNNC